MSGFILSHRKVWENPIFKGNAMRVGVWDWMLKQAAWRDTEHVVGTEIVKVSRGQMCVSQQQIVDATGVTRQQLRTLLTLLERTNAIRTQPATGSTKGRTLITICNYEEYQSPEKVDQPSDQPSANQGSNQAPTKRQPTKERREQGNKEEDAYASLPLGSGDSPIPANDVTHAVKRYNDAAQAAGWPQVKTMSASRTKALKARLKEVGGKDGWEAVLRQCVNSDFLSGRSEKPWTGFCFDWLVKAGNFTKIREGNYDNDRGGGGGAGGGAARKIDPTVAQALRANGGGS